MASVDTVDQNKRFAEEHGANFPILCDTTRAVTKLYGVGVTYDGELYSDRWTVYIDKEGIVRKVDKDVKPSTAGPDMLRTFSELGFAKKTTGPVSGDYKVSGTGLRRIEWDTDTGPLWIKVLVDASNLGGSGAEVAEIFFPPGYQGEPHPHELEIFYVLEGELGHIVDGVPHVLKPGMIGIVRAPDQVVHRSESKEGVRALVIWPLGNEVKGLEAAAIEDPEGRVVPTQP